MQTNSLPLRDISIAITPVIASGQFTRPAPRLAQLAKAAEKELGAFLVAVEKMFGREEVDRAASFWIQHFEAAHCLDSDLQKAFRKVTIQTAAQLATDEQAFGSLVRCALRGPSYPSLPIVSLIGVSSNVEGF